MESKTKHKTKTNKQKKKKYPHLPTFQSFQMFYCTFEKKKIIRPTQFSVPSQEDNFLYCFY